MSKALISYTRFLNEQHQSDNDNLQNEIDITKQTLLDEINIAKEVMKPATEISSGAPGLVPTPSPQDIGKVLGADAQWHEVSKTEIQQVLKNGIKIATITVDGNSVDLYCNEGKVYNEATTTAAGLMSATDKTNLNQVQQNVTNLNTSVSTINANIDTMNSNISDLNTNINGVKNDVTNINTSINNLNTNLDGVKSNVTDLVNTSGNNKVIKSATAPTNTSCLWIDTSNNGTLKYHNGSSWVSTTAVGVAVWG